MPTQKELLDNANLINKNLSGDKAEILAAVSKALETKPAKKVKKNADTSTKSKTSTDS